MTDVDLKGKRPISPHVQQGAYKVTFSMAISISHRMSGVALYAGTFFLAYWLIALAAGPEAFETAQMLWGSILGRLVLFGFTWALMHHMLGGIRHFIWDVPAMIEKPQIEFLYRATLIGGVVLTGLIWVIGYAAL
ncbi:succinate dehydrogenase, cytochrome b556 subunit [Cohaesibacter sp. CAU 1516]|uniref:succinate dehydrogenase, cytochrome b556 subunit n=1 Tax=Cohaesibacter sp. CAU 1516 TaxID=2576038 RepID=UPI0010FF0562|nr:succinate dehydrogenase, cytochrome b556 subunit [Cohaesibacter sp. CAU 1516]TLP46938.1 succinate dehydrogenase, cytochrome b556 subunit [Cohaesibacter sp. CAU 1516]